MYLSYKLNNVQCQILNDEGKQIYLNNSKCTLEGRDNCKLESFRKAVLWLNSVGFKGILEINIVGKYFEKWVRGKSVPPRNLLVSAFRASNALDTCLFTVEFKQVSRVNKLEKVSYDTKTLSIMSLMEELEGEDEE